MAEATERLLLQVDAATELLRQHMNDNERTVSKFDVAAQKTLDRFDGRLKKVGAGGMPGIDRSVDQARSSLSRLDAGIANIRSSLGSLAAGAGLAGLAGAAHTFIGLAEESKQMRAQLTLATSEFGTFAQGQADVERIAGNTRIGLSASTALYGTLVRAAQPLGRTQRDAAVATETFAKALKIGGATAEAASSATLQFSQALASGVLRGDEFNSIAEASPRILKLLADALGVPQGQLRALAAEGKLTSDKLYDALTNTKVTAGLEAEFRQLPVTTQEATPRSWRSAPSIAAPSCRPCSSTSSATGSRASATWRPAQKPPARACGPTSARFTTSSSRCSPAPTACSAGSRPAPITRATRSRAFLRDMTASVISAWLSTAASFTWKTPTRSPPTRRCPSITTPAATISGGTPAGAG